MYKYFPIYSASYLQCDVSSIMFTKERYHFLGLFPITPIPVYTKVTIDRNASYKDKI